MSRLKISTRIDSPRTAIIEYKGIRWGTLPVGVLPPPFRLYMDEDLQEEEWLPLWELLFSYNRERLFDYLAKAEHSELQCRRYLKSRLLHPELTEDLITLAKERNFLSNTRYSELYIRSLLESGKSRRYIISKLKLQKIPALIYEPLLQEYYVPEDSQAQLREEIKALLYRFRELPRTKAREKVYATLYRKGWELDEISQAWNAVEKE